MSICTDHEGLAQIAATFQLTSNNRGELGHFLYGDLELAEVQFQATPLFVAWELLTAGGRDDSAVVRGVLGHRGLQLAVQDFCGLAAGTLQPGHSELQAFTIQGHRLFLMLQVPLLPPQAPVPVLVRVFQQLVEAFTQDALPWDRLCEVCQKPGKLHQDPASIVLRLRRLCPECTETSPRQNLVERIHGWSRAPAVPKTENGNSAAPLFARAEVLWEEDSWEQALDLCQQALALDPGHQRARELAAEAQEALEFERLEIPPLAAWLRS